MKLTRRTFSTALFSMAVPAAWDSAAQGSFPTKPIRIICPFAPGGGSDFIARIAADVMGRRLGQSTIVENRPGAGGTIGTEMALKEAADGYTLLLVAGSYTVNPSIYKLKFDAIADITPVIQLSKGSYVLCVRSELPVNNLKELLEYAKKNPGKLTFASAGNGSHLHIASEYLFGTAKVEATHVPYKGTGPAIIDLVAGNVDMFIAGTEGLLPHVKSGRVRAIAVTTKERSPACPEVPTIAESGLPGYEVVAWHGLVAPKNLPPAVLAQINGALNEGLKAKDLVEKLAPTGVLPAGGTSQQFGSLLKEEIPRYAKVVRDHNIRPS